MKRPATPRPRVRDPNDDALEPTLDLGNVLGAIPLIIHLLNRRRFRRVEWVPMHYLKLTIQRNRRRIQLEQLLLLLLRIALPILLFFFLARPVINPTGLEQWLGSGGRSSQVVLIDDSMSMGFSAGEASAFARALQSAAGLLASVRPQDHCTVVTTSSARAPLDPRRRGFAARRDRGSHCGSAAHRHARGLAGGARGSRRGLAIVYLSHAAAHHFDRPPQERLG